MGQDQERHEGSSTHGHTHVYSPEQGHHGHYASIPDAATMLKAKVHMAINRIMAAYLSDLEQLGDEHDEAMGKLMDTLPDELKANVRLADIYGDARFEAIRRHVLKTGNDQNRELQELVDNLRLGEQ